MRTAWLLTLANISWSATLANMEANITIQIMSHTTYWSPYGPGDRLVKLQERRRRRKPQKCANSWLRLGDEEVTHYESESTYDLNLIVLYVKLDTRSICVHLSRHNNKSLVSNTHTQPLSTNTVKWVSEVWRGKNQWKPLQLVFCCTVVQKESPDKLYRAGLERFITNICLEKRALHFIYTHRHNRNKKNSIHNQNCQTNFPTESLCVFSFFMLFITILWCTAVFFVVVFWALFPFPMSQSQHSRDVVWHHTKLILLSDSKSERFEWGNASQIHRLVVFCFSFTS